MTTAEPRVETVPYKIRCAEIWGGVAAKQDSIATPGVRAAIHSSASGEAKGGDLYYLSVCAYDTLTRIAVADVRGHGEAVSHLSEWLYQALERRMNDADGAAVLTDLSAIVRERGFDAITTAVVATFHRDKKMLYYAYAGHPPLLLGRLGNGWLPLEAGPSAGPSNLPLGVFPGARYTQSQVQVEPGDRLFLYSDGVSECPGKGEELYGDDRLPAALEKFRTLPLPKARDAIHHDLVGYAGGPLVHDDCTFLLVEPLPSVPFWKRRILPGKPQQQ
jgi:phosphoserine phosphatase RsbU/P